MKKAVQLGAGNIGRGFIGALLSQSGYEVVFADVNAEIIGKLCADRGYTVHVMDEACEDIKITNVRGVDSTTPAAIEEMATAEIITTAVGPMILPRIAPSIARAIEARMQREDAPSLAVIACENAVRATAQLKTAVYESLGADAKAYADAHVSFADCAVDRIVPPVKSENIIDVVVEQYYEWDVERTGFIGGIPQVEGMTLVDDLSAYIERKLFTLNTGHAIAAYLGCLRGCKTIDESIAQPDILQLVQSAMRESGGGLTRKYSFDPATHEAYIQKILRRFRNPHLQDDVTRVGREPLRKLGAGDRLVKPMLTAHGYDLPVDHLLLGAAAALCYHNESDPQSVELQQKLTQNGVDATLPTITGITDSALLSRIAALYAALQTQLAQKAVDLTTLIS